MKNGVIMEIMTGYCIVLCQGEYIKLKPKENVEIGMKILFLEEDILALAKQEKMNSKWLPYASLAAAFIIFIGLGMFYYVNNLMIFSVVTVDINPSVELHLNRHNEVISFEAMNVDGEELLNIDIKGLTIDKVLSLLVEEAYTDGFIDDKRENYVMVTTVPIRINEGLNKELKLLIELGIKEDKTLQRVNIGITDSNVDELEKAGEIHMPLGLIAISDELDLADVTSVRVFFEDEDNVKTFEEKNRMIYRYRIENDVNVEIETSTEDDSVLVEIETEEVLSHEDTDVTKVGVHDRDRDRISDYESYDDKVALSDYIDKLVAYDTDDDEILSFIILAKEALLDDEADFEELKEIAEVYVEDLRIGEREQNRYSDEASDESDDDSSEEQTDDTVDDQDGHYGQSEDRGERGKTDHLDDESSMDEDIEDEDSDDEDIDDEDIEDEDTEDEDTEDEDTEDEDTDDEDTDDQDTDDEDSDDEANKGEDNKYKKGSDD